MLVEIALSLAIRHSNPSISETTANTYAQWVVEEATTRELDPWIFQAIVHQETRWTPGLVRHETNGSCSVGLGQINGKCDIASVTPLKDPHANIKRMGAVLTYFRSTCRSKCEDLGWLRAYNPGSPAYFAEIREAIRKYHAQNGQSAVLRLSAGVHAPGMFWKSTHRAGHECRMDFGSGDS